MTPTEFYKLATKMLAYSPYSNKPSQQLFLRTIRKDNKALQEAMSFFPTGNSLYSASSNSLTKFVTMHYGYTQTGDVERNIRSDIKSNKRERNK